MTKHSLLAEIKEDITQYCRIMSIATGVDIEIVDKNLVRLAGTGRYAHTVGQSIERADRIYKTVFANGKPLFIPNTHEHEICQGCPTLHECHELLNLCTPIVLDGKTQGIISIICFTEEDRIRIIAQKEIFCEFVEQMALAICGRLANEANSRKLRRTLNSFLHIVDNNTRGITVLDKQGNISYINEVAKKEFDLKKKAVGTPVALRETENILADMIEYEVTIRGKEHRVLGRYMELDVQDNEFNSVLLTDPWSYLTKILTQVTASGESIGGLSAIIGEGELLAQLKKRVIQIANTSSTVLISGESGTGKEMFARAIHAESNRRDKPFVAINCGAIPDELLESELFGYVRGAFTGASESGRVGKFELAHEGIIFLDEISSMSLYLQVKLLRVLQEKNFTRLGSNKPIQVDVRVIAATNHDLHELINQGMFRDDLYYRLNVVPLDLPPLRQRKEDIPHLAEYFLDKYCKRFGKPPARLSPAMLEIFQAYDWPGNIREFENCIEYMINIHEGGTLTPALIPLKIREACNLDRSTNRLITPLPNESLPILAPSADSDFPIIPLEELETAAIQQALARFGNSVPGKKKAAKALGIGVATLYRKLQKMEQ